MFQNMLSRHYLFLCNQFLAQFSMQSFETLQNSCTYIEDMYLILYICLKNLHYYFALFDLLVHVTFNTLTTAISIQIYFVYNDKWYCIYSTLYIFISVSPYGPVTQREFLQIALDKLADHPLAEIVRYLMSQNEPIDPNIQGMYL